MEHSTHSSRVAPKMAVLDTRVMALSTFQRMVLNTGRRSHCRKAATRRTDLPSIRILQTGCISQPGRALPGNMATAAAFFFPKMAEKTGNRFSKKIDTFTTLRLTSRTPRLFTPRDSSHRRGDRQIVEYPGRASLDLISSGD